MGLPASGRVGSHPKLPRTWAAGIVSAERPCSGWRGRGKRDPFPFRASCPRPISGFPRDPRDLAGNSLGYEVAYWDLRSQCNLGFMPKFRAAVLVTSLRRRDIGFHMQYSHDPPVVGGLGPRASPGIAWMWPSHSPPYLYLGPGVPIHWHATRGRWEAVYEVWNGCLPCAARRLPRLG